MNDYIEDLEVFQNNLYQQVSSRQLIPFPAAA